MATNWTINGIDGIWMTKNEYRELTAEIERLRGLSNLASAQGDVSVRAAQNGCSALEHGIICGARAYASNAYCPKHQQRFLRTGNPLLVRKRGPKEKENSK